MQTIATNLKLTAKQQAWLRAFAREHEALQARDYDRALLFDTKRCPVGTRDALIRRGMVAVHTVEGMGGGFTYYRVTGRGIDYTTGR